jgi:hypothetical protein
MLLQDFSAGIEAARVLSKGADWTQCEGSWRAAVNGMAFPQEN